MMRTTLATLAMASAIAGSLSLQAPAAQAAETGAVSMRRQIDCWIGMKFGEQPGQLIRGWVCEPRDYLVPETKQTAAPAASQLRLADEQHVAALGAGSHHR
jgi:hypothetical protein